MSSSRALRLAVFVDGCFWDGCELHSRPTKMILGSAARAWKIAVNKTRDQETSARLTQQGWTVVRVWEHEEPEAAADRVEATLLDTRAARATGAR